MKLLIAVLSSIGAIFIVYWLVFRRPGPLGVQCPKHGYKIAPSGVCPLCGYYDSMAP